MGNNRQFTDEQIALAICESCTRIEAANKLKISRRQLYDRLQSFEVQALIRTIRSDQLRKRLALLESAQESAIQTITGRYSFTNKLLFNYFRHFLVIDH